MTTVHGSPCLRIKPIESLPNMAKHRRKRYYAVVNGACEPAPGIFSSWYLHHITIVTRSDNNQEYNKCACDWQR